MISRQIYHHGMLVMTRVSGVVKSQELLDHVFWLIDAYSIGELRPGFRQLIYVDEIESMTLSEKDIYKVAEISLGLGQIRGSFQTAVIADKPHYMKLAQLHKSLAKSADLEVEIFSDLSAAFDWLQIENPDPSRYAG